MKWSVFWWEVDPATPDRIDFQVESTDEEDATGLFHATRTGEVVFDSEYNDNSSRPFPFRHRLPQYIVREVVRGSAKIFSKEKL